MSMTYATGTSMTTTAPAGPGVRFERRGSSVVITLDRPAKLNAINSGMKTAIANEIPRIARDPQVYGVILQAAGSRLFCAGGDIREFYELALSDPVGAAMECGREYSLIWQFDSFPKPTVGLIDGAVMGTGVGIVQALTHRVAGAGYRFQMPETAIGFFPDNGVCWHLARLPNEIGTWLGLTGTDIGRADAYRLGLVTHCIEAARFATIADALAAADPIDPVLDGLHAHPGDAPIDGLGAVIERCFSPNTVSEIVQRLEAEASQRAWCQETLATLRARSPMALEITLRHLRRVRHLDLRQTLMVDYRLAVQLVTANDFLEGVRARIIEKTGTPRWRPAALTDIGQAEVDRFFNPLHDRELNLPTRREMQAARG